jgi:hypothetical protein
MRRGSTPKYQISVSGINVSDMGKIYITIEQDTVEFTITDYTLDTNANTITFSMTQEQTLSLTADAPTKLQLKFINSAGEVYVSDIAYLTVEETLNEDVITYV